MQPADLDALQRCEMNSPHPPPRSAPAVDRPRSEGEEGEPQDAEEDGVAGPVLVHWVLADPLTAANGKGVRQKPFQKVWCGQQ